MTLRLRADSSFTAEEIPGIAFGILPQSSQLVGGSGKWWLGKDLPWPMGRELALRFLIVRPEGILRVPAPLTRIEATIERGQPVLKFHPYDLDDAEIVYLRKE